MVFFPGSVFKDDPGLRGYPHIYIFFFGGGGGGFFAKYLVLGPWARVFAPSCTACFVLGLLESTLFMSADLSVSWHYVITLRRGRPRPREQLLLKNYKA